MKMQSTRVFTMIFSLVLVLAACKAPSNSNYEALESDENRTTYLDMKVPSDFNWRTFEEFEVTLEADQRGLVQVKSTKGVVYHRANLNGADPYSFKLSVPSYEQEVVVLFRGEEATLNLASKNLMHAFYNANTQGINNNRSIIAGR